MKFDSVAESIEFSKEVNKCRNDPVYFIKEVLGFKTLYPAQEKIVRDFYRHKYSDQNQEYKKLVLRIGQRAGKTLLASSMACFEFFELISLENPAEHYGLVSIQPIVVSCVAAGADQARDGIYRLASGFLKESEFINKYWTLKYKEDRIECEEKNVFMQVRAANAATAAGYTAKAAFFDEIDLFQKTDSKMGSDMIYSKFVNSTKTLGRNGKVVAISSVQYTDGLINKLYYDGLEEMTPEKGELTLAVSFKTWEVNPSPEVSEEVLREEYKYKMDIFYRDFANQPEVSGGLMFPGGVRLTPMINVFERDELPDDYNHIHHVMAIDPAYRNDSFGIAVGYRVGEHIIIDGVKRFEKIASNEAFIKPSDIRNYILEWINKLHVQAFIFDTDMYLETLEEVKNHGIELVKHVAGIDAYSQWLELNDGIGPYQLDVVHDELLLREARQLVKKQTATGKIKPDHPWNGSKDVSDCVANCIWYLTSHETGATYKPVIMMRRF